jgi:hypothetical protein
MSSDQSLKFPHHNHGSGVTQKMKINIKSKIDMLRLFLLQCIAFLVLSVTCVVVLLLLMKGMSSVSQTFYDCIDQTNIHGKSVVKFTFNEYTHTFSDSGGLKKLGAKWGVDKICFLMSC